MIVKNSNSAKLPTVYGVFDVISFKEINTRKEHLVISYGNVRGKENVVIRVHSECLTGDTFFSLKCDCGEQLRRSVKTIVKNKFGMIIYLRQEGRGIGLFDKINAYALQDKGFNTMEANIELGHDVDKRVYSVVKKVLEFYKIKSIRLISNNPAKSDSLLAMKIKINEIIPLIIKPNLYNRKYLKDKKNKMNHKL